MTIKTSFCPVATAHIDLLPLIIEHFQVSQNSQGRIQKDIKEHFDQLSGNCYFVVEAPYVDKVFRDSFYSYYSSKLIPYKRDCIRISIFDGEISKDDFVPFQEENYEALWHRYRGFIILRPTEPNIIGRSVIAPKALRNHSLEICQTGFDTTTNGLKFRVHGFPYSSQDSETITCAETTIWAIMEYFGHRYPEYKPVLPSSIISTLNRTAEERTCND